MLLLGFMNAESGPPIHVQPTAHGSHVTRQQYFLRQAKPPEKEK